MPERNWTEEQKRAICAVTASISGYKPNTGTAFYVGGGYVITALHVVADTRPRDPVFAEAIRLNFKYAPHETDAFVVEGAWNRNADWVVLQCKNDPEVKPLLFGALPEKGSAIEAFGYPEIQVDGFSLPALVQDPNFRNANEPALDLYSEKGKGVALYGLSGAPCMYEGKAVGIIRTVLQTEVLDGQLKPKLVTDAGTVYACPSGSVIEWQEVRGRAILGGTWAPATVTTSDFLVYLSSLEPDSASDGRLKGVIKAAGKHIVELNLGSPHFESAEAVIGSDEKLMQSVAALCRAKVVVLDATDFEPAIMLLAGIRSVVRRGVTILSVGGTYALGGQLTMPFNIADANIVAHSDAQDEQATNSVDLLVERLRRGVSETESPYYLDTPVFDALRRIPADRRGIIPSEEGVLVLCPFEGDYNKRNWKPMRLALNDQLKALRTKRELPAEGAELGVARSFELQSPRLVSQAIYEYIRRAKSCVVDLTAWSPNVLFELGVRIAASAAPTACLIEGDYQSWFDKQTDKKHWRTQCESLIARFVSPAWQYNATSWWQSESAYGKAYGTEAEFPGSGPASGVVQGIIEKALDVSAEPASRPVYKELMDSADLFAKTPGRSKPVGLYPGNADLAAREEKAEFERLLAGWFYLVNRPSEQEMEIIDERRAARDIAVKLVSRRVMFERLPDTLKASLEAFLTKRTEKDR